MWKERGKGRIEGDMEGSREEKETWNEGDEEREGGEGDIK